MAKLEWDSLTDRVFEAGVEKGVIYIGDNPGVAWSGLVSVEHSYEGSEVEPRYFDGIKTAQYFTPPSFTATISAFTYPDVFEQCLGYESFEQGIYADEQIRKQFGMSYQTRIGDAVSPNRGLKIHLIYNALVGSSGASYGTLSEDVNPSLFQWGITTVPLPVPNRRPASHLVIDSRRVGPELFKHLVDTLQGGYNTEPHLPTPVEIADIVGGWHVLYPSSTTYPATNTLPGAP